ncbi:MAG: hypothetical protein AAFY19_00435 [Pseudomonadota bacterium]
MQPDDFNDLQALWQTPDPVVQQRVEVMSRRVLQRQRLLELAEILLGAGLLLLVMITALNVGTAMAALTGLGISLLIIYSAWSRSRSRRIEALIDVRGQHAYLVQLLIGARARLRRLVVGLALFVPGLVLGNLFSAATGISDEQLREFLNVSMPGGPIVGVSIMLATIIVPIAMLVRAIMRERARIKQLEIAIDGFEADLDQDIFEAG